MGDLRLDQALRHDAGLLSAVTLLLYGLVVLAGLIRGPRPVPLATASTLSSRP